MLIFISLSYIPIPKNTKASSSPKPESSLNKLYSEIFSKMSDLLKNFSGAMSDVGLRSQVSRKRIVSSFGIKPGSVYTFLYEGKPVVFYVVQTNRAPQGVYTSNKGNKLVTGFKTEFQPEAPDLGLRLLVKNLFSTRRTAKYSKVTEKAIEAKDPLNEKFIREEGNAKSGDNIPPSRTKSLVAIAGLKNFRSYNFKKMSNIYQIILSKQE